MASNFVNPLDANATFKNQQLAPINNQRSSRPGSKISAGEDTFKSSTELGKPSLDGLKNIRERASRQHKLYLQAVKADQARRQPKVQYMNGSGGYSYSGGGGGGGPMGGRYNLIPGADRALAAMDAAYRSQFGRGLSVNSGGRSYQDQVEAWRKYQNGGNLAARPGTSVHESGRAVDFGGAIQNSGSREHRWLQQNAGTWGFKWTGKNFSQVEPWHWEWWG